MSLLYKTMLRKVVTKSGEADAYYGMAVRTGVVTMDQLAEDISKESTVTRHDVKAVISALEEHVMRELMNNKSVRLGDLGSFHITFKSKGAASLSEWSTKLIEGCNVRFTKSARMKSTFNVKNLKFANAEEVLI